MKFLAASLFAAGLLATPSLHAQEAPAESKSASGAPAEKDLSGWQWANFLVLAAVLGYFGVKMGSPYFQGQAKSIGQGLDSARQQRVQAEIRANEVSRKLDNLGADIEALRKDVLGEQAAQSERMKKQAEIEMDRVHANASQQIEIAGKQARLELQRYASRLALDLAEQRVRNRMTPDVQRALTGQFVESLRA